MYAQLRILMFEGNRIIYYVAPIGLMMGMIVCILLGSTIVVIDQLPVGIKPACFCILLGSGTASLVMFPFAAAVHEGSKNARKFWELRKNKLLKWERKGVKSWRRIMVEIGPFFGVVNSTAATFLYHTMNNTGSLILWLKFNYSGTILVK